MFHRFYIFSCFFPEHEGVLFLSAIWYFVMLIFTPVWENSAEDILMIFFLFFSENRIWHFMQIVSIGDNLHVLSILFAGEK